MQHLLTSLQGLLDQIPGLYQTEGEENPKVWAKIVIQDLHWAWYIIELDRNSGTCFGYVDGDLPELGYFSLHEIEETAKSMGRLVLRDIRFEPVDRQQFEEKILRN
jgi:hypothetical protein